MNIVRLTHRIFPDKAGPAKYAYLLSKYISNENFRVFNIACRPNQVKAKTKVVNPNFIIHYLPIHAPRWDEKKNIQLLFLFRFFYHSFKKILELHRKYRIDLIHCDNPSITGFIALLFNRIFKIPFIYTHHGLDSHFKINFLLELGLIYRFSKYHIIISRRMKKYFKINKVDTSKLVWIPNGIEINKFFHVKNKDEKAIIIKDLKLTSILKPNDFIISYIGYMDLEQKVRGMIDFLYGFKKFLNTINIERQKNIKLLYIGDGKYRKLLEKEINNLNLKANVYTLGVRLDIEKFYAISDFSALTSYVEGVPTVVLEAIASKVPCICTDVGEINEILIKESIVPCGEIDEIALKLKTFYNDENLCKNLIESCFK
ncbi:MAG: glycosyltransferase family 4 protein, partial [Promethearchaeota archaeon]